MVVDDGVIIYRTITQPKVTKLCFVLYFFFNFVRPTGFVKIVGLIMSGKVSLYRMEDKNLLRKTSSRLGN